MGVKMKLIKRGENAEVRLDGRLDAQNAPEVEKALLEIAERFQAVELDLEKMDYISSAGLRAFRNFNVAMRRGGKDYRVKNVQKTIMEIFEMTGYIRLLKL